jgi:hypothetical protein
VGGLAGHRPVQVNVGHGPEASQSKARHGRNESTHQPPADLSRQKPDISPLAASRRPTRRCGTEQALVVDTRLSVRGYPDPLP